MLFLPLAAALSLNTLPGRVPGLSERERLAATLSLRDTTTQRVETRGVDADGAFAFAVSDGEYVLALDAARAELPWSYLVRVEAGEVDVHILPPNSALAAVGPAQPLPLEIKATHPQLVPRRPSFSLLKFVFTPTVLISVALIAFIFLLPSILGSLDPEVLAEMRKQQGAPKEFDIAEKIAEFRVGK